MEKIKKFSIWFLSILTPISNFLLSVLAPKKNNWERKSKINLGDRGAISNGHRQRTFNPLGWWLSFFRATAKITWPFHFSLKLQWFIFSVYFIFYVSPCFSFPPAGGSGCQSSLLLLPSSFPPHWIHPFFFFQRSQMGIYLREKIARQNILSFYKNVKLFLKYNFFSFLLTHTFFKRRPLAPLSEVSLIIAFVKEGKGGSAPSVRWLFKICNFALRIRNFYEPFLTVFKIAIKNGFKKGRREGHFPTSTNLMHKIL